MRDRRPPRTRSSSKRVHVPDPLQRKLLIECGFQCSMPGCSVSRALEFHHVDSDRSNNSESNLLVLCHVHHALAHERGAKLDRQACKLLRLALWIRRR